MTTTPSIDQPAKVNEDDNPQAAQGLVAGTVLRTARQSAGVSMSELAAAVNVTDNLILSWENGIQPLACLPVALIDGIKSALRAAGADARLVDDLDPAAWCDLVIEAVVAHEDASCLLADPLATEPGFTELLTWAITGHAPARYASCADTVSLTAVPVEEAVLINLRNLTATTGRPEDVAGD